MTSRTVAASAVSALAGALLGLVAMALVAARTLGGTLDVIGPETGAAPEPAFVLGQAAFYLYVVLAGAAGGAVLGLLAYGIAAQDDAADERFPAGPIVAVASVVGAVAAFAAMRSTVGITGDIVDGTVQLAVFRAVIVALVTGATTGLVVGASVERLARRDLLGLRGVAWPQSVAAFARESATAVGLPALAMVIGAVLVYGFSELILGAETTVGLILFGGVAAVILFGAALIAAMPPRTRD